MKPSEEKKMRQAVLECAQALVAIQTKLHNAGMHASAKKLNQATNELGWELDRKLKPRKAAKRATQ